MIPKTIHYCWFGGKELSHLEKKCIASWKKHFPDFEIKLWNEQNFDINLCEFVNVAYREKKYAFVSDVARIFALNTEGGIYLDTDMLFVRPFPFEFLNFNLFLGKESKNVHNAAIIGSSRQNPILLSILERYLSFKSFDFENLLIPQIISNELENHVNGKDFVSFSPDYFYPLPYKLRKFHYNKFLTENSIAVHLWNLSWKNLPSLKKDQKILSFIKYWISYYYVPISFKEYANRILY